MALSVLVLDVVFLLAAFGARTLIQWRRTRDTGWRLGRPNSTLELVARVLLFASAALLAAAVVEALVDSVSEASAVQVVGIALCLAAIVLVVVAQLHMGSSWRIGVDLEERTELVRTGLYRSMRNPIYTGMVVFAFGQALLLPGIWTATAVVAMIAGVELQVRAVEEPYLRGTHGPSYTQWAAATGRFVPFVGTATVD